MTWLLTLFLQLDDAAWEKAINDEVEALLSEVNVSELTKRASSLNGGKHCKFQPGKHIGAGSLMGCANYHAILIFDDCEEWLARIPRTGLSDVPIDLVEYLVASEYATLKFLESTTLPSPKAFGYGILSDTTNTVGVNYILMKKLPGKPYYPYLATPEQQTRVISQVADYLIELSKHHFPRAGSLLSTDDGSIEVGPVASNRFVYLGKYGPFDRAVDYFTGIADEYLSLIADKQVYDQYPKEAFLFYKLLHQHAADLCCNETPGAFYLKHVDDKGDHLLIDDDYNVTGIIDWQFARVVPACEAFGPSLVTADLGALYSGKASLSQDDKTFLKELKHKGRDDLAGHSSDLDPVRRFHLGLASGFNRDEACDLIKGMLVALGEEFVDIESSIEQESEKCRDDYRWNLLLS